MKAKSTFTSKSQFRKLQAFFLVSAVLLLIGPMVYGQTFPRCIEPSSANDATFTNYWLEIDDTDCEPGDPVQASLMATLNVNRATGIFCVASVIDIYVDGVLVNQDLVTQLGGSFPKGNYDVEIASFTWPCGSVLEIENVYAIWNFQDPGTSCPDVTDEAAFCAAYSTQSRAWQDAGTILVPAPLVAIIAEPFIECDGSAFSTVTYTSATTGGITPYTYSWDLGDVNDYDIVSGSLTSNEIVVTYKSVGTKSATLTVTDSDSPANISTDEATALVESCCLPAEISCPDPVDLPACAPLVDIQQAYADWVAGFTYEEGCSPSDNIASVPALPTEVACEGADLSFTYAVTDDFGTVTCTSTFKVAAPDAVTYTAPADENVDACDFEDQAALDSFFDVWIGGQLTDLGGGCSPTFTHDWVDAYPTLCEDDDIVVTWTITDKCYSNTVSATFSLTAPAAVTYTAPVDEDVDACDFEDQAALDSFFDVWIGDQLTDLGGGCSPTFTHDWVDAYPTLCEDDDIVVTWTITDKCYSNTVSATFSLTAPAAVTYTAPVDEDVDACEFEDQAALDSFFDVWLADQLSDLGGGCSPTFTHDWVDAYPTLCEDDDIVVTWTITDKCYSNTVSATFSLTAPAAVTYIAPVDEDVDACEFEDQAALDSFFDVWIGDQLSDLGGGCSPTFTHDWVDAYPTLCEDDDIVVTWTITDKCYINTVSATFSLTAPAVVTYTAPVDEDVAACDFENQAALDSFFDIWLQDQLSDLGGGCSPTFTHDWVDAYPTLCEDDDIVVTWTITDKCYINTVSATFSLTAPAVVTYTAPADEELDVCNFETQIALETYFDSWLDDQLSDLGGGCSPTFTHDFDGTYPDIHEGGVVTVTWEIADDPCFSTIVSATFTLNPQTVLEGNVSYYLATDPNVPLEGLEVKALLGNNNLTKNGDPTVFTDASGDYKFEGDWVKDIIGVEVSTALPHGGLSAIDALAVQIRGLGIDPRTVASYWDEDNDGLVQHTGYVSKGNNPFSPGNPIGVFDALFILSRHIYPTSTPFIDYWDADWAFYAVYQNNIPVKVATILDVIPFDVLDDNTGYLEYMTDCNTLDIEVRALGDVRGTYLIQMDQSKNLDATARKIQTADVIQVSKDEVFELPLKVMSKMEYSALDLEILYDSRKVEVIDVLSDNEDLIFAIHEDRVNMAWADVHSITIDRGEAVATLVVRTIDTVNPEDELFRQSGRSEFGSSGAEALTWFELAISSVDNTILDVDDKPGMSEFSFSAYPNPFRGQLNLTYELEAPADVRITIMNTMGAVVGEVINEPHGAGRYQRVFNANESQFKQGIYFVRVDVSGQASSYSEMIRLVHIK